MVVVLYNPPYLPECIIALPPVADVIKSNHIRLGAVVVAADGRSALVPAKKMLYGGELSVL